jgi:hypothetical protein
MAGCRGKHNEVALQWGRWLHRLVRPGRLNTSEGHSESNYSGKKWATRRGLREIACGSADNKAAQPAVSERQKADEKEHERKAKPGTDVQRCPK